MGTYGCPRCGAPVRPITDPDLGGTSPAPDPDSWWCEADGVVAPLLPAQEPSVHALLEHLTASSYPSWVPWPLPQGWSVAGAAAVGLRRRTASVLAVSGPDPLGGLGDLLVICEEPGTGLGARLAGVDGPDPGPHLRHLEPHTRVQVDGHATPLWWLAVSQDRDVLVGEATGRWLWLITWPATSGVLVHDQWQLVDMHDLLAELEVIPLTGLSTRLPDVA